MVKYIAIINGKMGTGGGDVSGNFIEILTLL